MAYEKYFSNHVSDVHASNTFKEFVEMHPIFSDFGTYEGYSWLEKRYDAVKARKDIDPNFNLDRTLQLPKALKFSDIFSHAEIRKEKTPNPNSDYFCSTYSMDGIIADGWQDNEDGTPLKNGDFLHLRVIPTKEVVEAFDSHIGGKGISSFELVNRGGEYLVIAKSLDSSIFKSWIAIIYDLPENIKKVKSNDLY